MHCDVWSMASDVLQTRSGQKTCLNGYNHSECPFHDKEGALARQAAAFRCHNPDRIQTIWGIPEGGGVRGWGGWGGARCGPGWVLVPPRRGRVGPRCPVADPGCTLEPGHDPRPRPGGGGGGGQVWLGRVQVGSGSGLGPPTSGPGWPPSTPALTPTQAIQQKICAWMWAVGKSACFSV